MRIVAAVILLAVSAGAQIGVRIVSVRSQGSTVRVCVEIVNNRRTTFFVHTCSHLWRAAESKSDEEICSALPQRLVHRKWKYLQMRGGIIGSDFPEEGATIAAGKSARLEAEFSTCVYPVSRRDTIRLRISPSAYGDLDEEPLFTTAFHVGNVESCSK